ncbi:MAG TPA: hypothetical protein VFN46_08515 [Acetobacteraceae bacterium]|nr:hypothetical protein [Acetobacteraceae bacterium]
MKRARIALLTAAVICSIGFAARPSRAAGAATLWSDLWRTPDQQGQALLDAGEPAAAAARFRDPRRRAYADLRAGRNAPAAKLLAPFTDVESEYNRGNALARSGQLQAALAAYDAALKQAPRDADIRHNRDLVERALRHQPRSAQSSSGRGGQGAQRSASAGRQGQRSGAGQSQPNGGAQAASNGSQSGAGRSGNTGRQQPGAPQAAGDRGSGASKESPGQARRDAAFAAAMARRRQHGGTGNSSGQQGSQGADSKAGPGGANRQPGSSGLVAGGTRTPPQKPESERQLALDQWLRQIPDSPAGLLRRKFLIEHMMRQQDGGDPREGVQ